ncbi:MAG: effector-associated domain EAD1-containing protein [Synechococcus sp.]
MAIDWNKANFEVFLDALQEVYPSANELEIFADLRLDRNLSEITSPNDNLRVAVYKLLKLGKREDSLDEFFAAFRQENPNHLAVKRIENPLVKRIYKISQENWDALFDCFDERRDSIYIPTSFIRAFQRLKRDFWKERPEHPPLTNLSQIRDLLIIFDEPKLAVRFVEQFIIEVKRSDSKRDFSELLDWRDRIVGEFDVDSEELEPDKIVEKHGYLLISLRLSGRLTRDGPDVTVLPELYVENEPESLEFNVSSVTCPLEEVASHISDWVRSAEEALIPYNCARRLTLELFLPCVHLEEDVAARWEIRDRLNNSRFMGTETRYIVRSTERALDKILRSFIEDNWAKLQTVDENSHASSYVHVQKDCPKVGELTAALDDKLLLNLAAELPAEREERIEIYYDIINSGVPIAVWSCECGDRSVDERETEFNYLTEESQLTNFADLAKKWRTRRVQPENKVAKHMRILCDCPERWPNFPDLDRDEDLLIAIY